MIEKLRLVDEVLLWRVTGDSMAPALAQGDRLTVVPARTVAVGDLVAVRLGGEAVCHRVIEVRADGSLVTRGDAVGRDDEPVAREAVLGVVAAVRPGRRRPPLGLLARSLPFKRLLGSLAGLTWRVRLALPAPIGAVRAYSLAPLEGTRAGVGTGGLVVATLLGRVVARLDPETGEARAHAALAGYGLEERLCRRWASGR